jgi:hypothetical protein
MSAQEVDPGIQAGAEENTEELRARLELLREENRRLRDTHARLRQTRQRRTVIGLAGLGVIGLAGGALFPAGRVVLIVLGATGLFGALLTWYLTPERFVAAEVGERIYAALARNLVGITDELGLADRRVYVPLPEAPHREAVLYVPQSEAADLPSPATLETVFVVPDEPQYRGLAIRPTGEPLIEELQRAAAGGFATTPVPLADQLTEGLREQFELVDTIHPELNPEDTRATFAISGSAYGDIDRFDHPVPSLLGSGFAVGLDTAVEIAVDRTPDSRGEFLVTVRWELEDAGAANSSQGAEQSV